MRTKIFLNQYDELQQFADTSDLEYLNDAKFFNNMTVDLFNKAIGYTTSLKDMTANEIRQDTSKENDAILFCKVVLFIG